MKKFNFKTLLLAIGLVVASVQPVWSTLYIYGSWDSWGWHSIEGSGWTSGELQANTTYYFKVRDDYNDGGTDLVKGTSGTYKSGNPVSGQMTFTLSCPGYVKFTIANDGWKINTEGIPVTRCITGNNWFDGNSWDAKKTPMTWDADAGCYTYRVSNVPTGSGYQLKVTDGTWNNSWGHNVYDVSKSSGIEESDADGNIKFSISSAKDVVVKYYINDDNKIGITATPSNAIVGSFNNWDATQGELVNGSKTIHLEANKTYELKVISAGVWRSNNSAITSSVSNWGFSDSEDGNCHLTTAVAGDYTFSWNSSNNQLSVTYPTISHPSADYYYIKNAANWGQVNLHLYHTDGGDVPIDSWPGPLPSSTTIGGNTFYYFAAGSETKASINNNGDDNTKKDVTLSGNKGKYYDNSSNSWKSFQTALTLDKNNSDASGSTNGSATIAFGATSFTSHIAPERTGYDLEGYYKETGCTNKIANADGSLVQNTTYTDANGKWNTTNEAEPLYAKWTIHNYSITYSPATAEHCTYSVKPTSAHYNESVSMTITPDDGYTVTSVSTSPSAVVTQDGNVFSFTMPASDVIVTIVTSLSKVQVTSGVHSSGNGQLTVSPEPDANGKVDAGANVTFTADPNDGYKVVGFYSDALCSNENLLQAGTTEGSNEMHTIEKISAAASVYVKFAPITYTYTFEENGGTAQTDGTYNIESEPITLPTSEQISRTGYDFAGWFANSDFSGNVVTTLTTGSWGNKTYYAKWTAHTYSVHFDANSTEGIAGSMEDQTGFTYDVNKTLTACGFTKQGYTFAGWATTSGGSVAYSNEQSVSNLTAENNATVTLYAKWTPANFELHLTTNKADANGIHNIQINGGDITLTASATLNDAPYTLNLEHFNYTYQLVGSEDTPTAINTQTTNSTTWSAPTKVGHYTLTVSYNDGTITDKSASIDFVVWDEYTFYVWETGQDLNTADQNANKVHVYHKKNTDDSDADYSETTWGDTPEGLRDITDLSSQWGGGWHSFTIKYPLYNFFIIGYNAYKADQYQSNAYYLSKEPSAKDTYLRCNYHNDGKWTWGDHSISEPTKPTIEITEVKTYSSIIKVTIKYNPNYSHITEHSLTINGQEKTLDGFDDTDEKEYTLTLTDLTARTDYNFVASARNAIDNEEVSKTITTPAANKVRITARKAKNHQWTAMGFYAWSSATEGKLFDDMSDYNLPGVESGDYWVYTFELPDSPAKFYLTNGSSKTGLNRTQDIETTTDVCVTVIDGEWGGNRGYNHNSYCGAHYQLSFTNSSGVTTYSNIIDSPDDIMSLYIGKTGDGTLKLRHYDAAQDKIVDYITTGFTLPASANVYNVSLKDVSDFDNITIANLGDFVPYIGQYYIRTDAATGGWQEYLFADKDNAMTEFTPRRDKGEDYSYYWVKNVAKTSTVRVSACVGNDYNPDLANMLTYDDFVHKGDDGHGYIYQLTNGANVRFSYEPTTNEFKRAVIGGSGANDFLNVYSNDNNVYATKNGGILSDLLNVAQKEAQISKFNDVSDWVYEKVVYVEVESSSSAASVILQSKFNSQTNYLLGYESDGTTLKPLEVLGTGTNPDTYIIRITYDYKKNRLMASWEPGTIQISVNQSINTDILFIQRENANGAIDDVDVAQITYTPEGITNEAKLTSLKNIIYVLEVTQKVMEGVAIDNQEYWITLPFDCRISDVFGVEDYVKLDANGNAISGTWGIMRYDGATRASHGWFLDDYSTFWRWMTRDETMHAGEGYVVIFDKTNASSWPSINVDGENKQVKRLYFPSMTTGFTISYSKENRSVEYSNNPCTVQKRGDQDSNWKVLGPKSYNNIDVDNAVDHNLTYYYTYHQANGKGNKYVGHNVTNEPTLKSFHSYMAQFGGDLTWKPFTKSDLNQAPLFAAIEQTFKGGMLTIELVQNNEQLDRTFVNLHKNGTTGFDNNMELVAISENCAQISTISEGIEYAGTTLPLSTELVPLNVKVIANGTYDIALSESLEGLEVRLYDAFEQTTTPLDMMSATVTLNKGEYKDRFYLQLKQKSGETPTSFEGKIEQYNLPTDKTQKLLINGNIYLINGGRIYNATGVQLR